MKEYFAIPKGYNLTDFMLQNHNLYHINMHYLECFTGNGTYEREC